MYTSNLRPCHCCPGSDGRRPSPLKVAALGLSNGCWTVVSAPTEASQCSAGTHHLSRNLSWDHIWAVGPPPRGPATKRHQAPPGGATPEGDLCGFSPQAGEHGPRCAATANYGGPSADTSTRGHMGDMDSPPCPSGHPPSPDGNVSPIHIPDLQALPKCSRPLNLPLAGHTSATSYGHLSPPLEVGSRRKGTWPCKP